MTERICFAGNLYSITRKKIRIRKQLDYSALFQNIEHLDHWVRLDYKKLSFAWKETLNTTYIIFYEDVRKHVIKIY